VSIRGKAHIAGAYEHPDRKIPGKSVAQVHAEVAIGALNDAGLAMSDVDAYFCAGTRLASGRFQWPTTSA